VQGNARPTFETTVLPHLDAAYMLARYLLRDDEEARDVVQDACLRAVRHFASFRGGDARAWLLAIVRNTCHDHLRHQHAASMTTPFQDELHSPEADDESVGSLLVQRVSPAAVRTAVDELAVEFREVVILREVHGYSYKEIGAIIGVPVGTVMSRLARARQRLREALASPTDRGRGGEGV
jgi:RNA polymerase sigma-70 factor (ECF subfamily)